MEFAIVVPILLLLIVGIAEFARAWMTQNILTSATREAARVAAVESGGVEAGEEHGNQIASGVGGFVTVSDPGVPNGQVTATGTSQFDFFFTGFLAVFAPGLPNSITLTSTTTIRREY